MVQRGAEGDLLHCSHEPSGHDIPARSSLCPRVIPCDMAVQAPVPMKSDFLVDLVSCKRTYRIDDKGGLSGCAYRP